MVSGNNADSKIELHRHRLFGLSFVVNESFDEDSGDLSMGFFIESNYELIDIADSSYGVIVDTGVVAKVGKHDLFRIDVKYLGAFSVKIDNEKKRIQALKTTCPEELFPYICKKIADITEDADFPPLMMSHTELKRLYDKQRKRWT